ncbi:MAG TPA: N-(5'-phosphoribosyl)anthranilate isomerase [Desulfotomaculum sp.]|nr:MAG: N-(5'-phosphoribosyl)anthranilate isomerase [Desulfotomaculum sp. 46_80]KUK85270.1 MAG: N-(5'-phosphoribosyl)anthranilate isomerase [Desulfofundulus kuznetsovii]HAG11453.1 N-(5'-phosphoribosyl)anthranilate isomerase [Desulfotomaculum sp.]HBY03227.1 N-(5'-phosphoribosyl)anthranilate isomerase [Desulfotomaculum sp.]
MVWVKICGITDLETALYSAEAGADALGFVFAPSIRRIAPEAARLISLELPSRVLKAGVFVNSTIKEVQQIIEFCRLDIAQLHGDESQEYCRQINGNCKVIKAFNVQSPLFGLIDSYPADAVLIDTFLPGKAGGTGEVFDWKSLESLNRTKPVILAGGLNQSNVKEAVLSVRPDGVDVSSGVETNQKKDLVKIMQFINSVKEVTHL